MSSRDLLSASQREQFLKVHVSMSEREIARYYSLSEKDLRIIRRHRRDHNRLGFAVQLCLLRFPGWPLKAGEIPPPHLVFHVALQLGINPDLFRKYSYHRDTTRREHVLELQRDFGFRPFDASISRRLAETVLPEALRSPKPVPLVEALLERMRAEKVVFPALSAIESLAWEILTRAETIVVDQLTRRLTAAQAERLDTLTSSDEVQRGLTWLRQPAGRPSPPNFLRLSERRDFIRAIDIEKDVERSVHQNRLKQLAREGARYSLQHIRNFPAKKRQALLVA
jgi:TnpA family transposase